jgi:D-alanyl-D-alanine carboxypeptidase
MKRNIVLLLFSFILSIPFWWEVNLIQKGFEDFLTAQISKPFEVFVNLNNQPAVPPEIRKEVTAEDNQKPDLELQVKSAVSVEINNKKGQKFLFEKEADAILPIASLTKLMTAVIVLDDPVNYNFDKIVTVSREAVAQEENFGNLKIGEKISIKNLLYIMLIESSNDAAFALSEVIGTENFVARMNQKAIELGLKNTYFINPTGLDVDEIENDISYFNFSTASDLARLSEYILRQYPQIWEISSKMSYEILNAEGNFHHLAINKNGFLNLSPEFTTLGWKTGYTNMAGGCLILILKDKKERTLINVILGAPSPDLRLEEMKKLINYLTPVK